MLYLANKQGDFSEIWRLFCPKYLELTGLAYCQEFDNIFCPQLSKAKEDVTQNSMIVYETNKGNIDRWWIISSQIFGKEMIS